MLESNKVTILMLKNTIYVSVLHYLTLAQTLSIISKCFLLYSHV